MISFFAYQTLALAPSAPLSSIWQIQLARHEHYGSVDTPQPRSWQGKGRMGTGDMSQTDTEAWHWGSSIWPVSWLQLEDPVPWQVGRVNCSSGLWSITAPHLSSNITALYFPMPLHSTPSSAALTVSSLWRQISPHWLYFVLVFMAKWNRFCSQSIMISSCLQFCSDGPPISKTEKCIHSKTYQIKFGAHEHGVRRKHLACCDQKPNWI